MKELYAFYQKLTTQPEVGLFNVAKNFIGKGISRDFDVAFESLKFKSHLSGDLPDGSHMTGFINREDNADIDQACVIFQNGTLTHLSHTQQNMDCKTMVDHAKSYGYVEREKSLNEDNDCKFLYNVPLNITCIISEEKSEEGSTQLVIAFGEGRLTIEAEKTINN